MELVLIASVVSGAALIGGIKTENAIVIFLAAGILAFVLYPYSLFALVLWFGYQRYKSR